MRCIQLRGGLSGKLSSTFVASLSANRMNEDSADFWDFYVASYLWVRIDPSSDSGAAQRVLCSAPDLVSDSER